MRGVLKWHLSTYPFVKLTEHGFVVCRVDDFQPDVEALIYMTGIVIISCHAWKGYGQIQCGLVQSVLKLMHKSKDTFSLLPTLGETVGAVLSEFRLIDIDTNHFYMICLFIRIAFLLSIWKFMMHYVLNFPMFRLLFLLQELMKWIHYFILKIFWIILRYNLFNDFIYAFVVQFIYFTVEENTFYIFQRQKKLINILKLHEYTNRTGKRDWENTQSKGVFSTGETQDH